MRSSVPLAVSVALIALVVGLGGCKKKVNVPTAPVAPPPAPPQIQPKKEPPPPPLTASQKIQIEQEFNAVRAFVLEARQLKAKGEQLEREKGREAANDTLVAAKKLYQKAIQATEAWVEPDVDGRISKAQAKSDPDLIRYAGERGGWIQESASLGTKLNQK